MQDNTKFFNAPKNPSGSKFKNDRGMLLTKSLFLEFSLNKDQVLYTLRDDESRGYPSLKRLYLEHRDPTEYTFALACFENWRHWEMLAESTFFKPYITEWRKELEIKLKSEELHRIKAVAESGSKESLQASKYLLDKGWDKPKSTRGRPSKADIAAEANKIALDKARVEEDFERIIGNA